MGEPKAELTPTQRCEALWKVIARYDMYIGSTNTKAAFLIAFNTFVVGGVVLKWQDIRSAVGETSPPSFPLVAVLLLVAVGAALASLYLTFQAINPFLSSPKRPNEYHSNVFFGDVSEHGDPEKYAQAVGRWDDAALQKDLAFQAHTLAGSLSAKFVAIKNAIRAVVYVQLPALALTTIVVLWAVVAGLLHSAGK